MFDHLIKACAVMSGSHVRPDLPAATEQAPVASLPAISFNFDAPTPTGASAEASCLDDIFSDIINDQPKFGFRV